MAMLTDCNAINVDSIPVIAKSSTSIDNQSTSLDSAINVNTNYQRNNYDNINSPLRLFSHVYGGPVIVLVECIDPNKNLGNWHPLKSAKLFSSNFKGIPNIKPASANKIKITFNSMGNGNLCLNSKILSNNGFTVSNLGFKLSI